MSKKVFVVDNYDSFTYNLVHYLKELGCTLSVKRNDAFEMDAVADYDAVVLSPGPGIPNESGLLKPLIKWYAPTQKILGVCLGQQAIAEVFGGTIINLKKVYHGVATAISVTEDDLLFKSLPQNLMVGRYHSWVVQTPLPESLIATSLDETGQVMSLRHKEYDVRAVQFHPESVLTPHGKQMLKNWIHSE